MGIVDSRVLVTGGAGFIGSHLVDRLIQQGARRILVVDDLSLGREENLVAARAAHPELVFQQLDLADDGALDALLAHGDFDYCFNLAVIPLPASLVKPKWVADRNMMMTSSVCEFQRLGHIGKMVHFSSSEVYGTARRVPMDEEHPLEAETPYAASKVGADSLVQSYLRTFGTPVVTLRPFNNYGPRQNDKAYAGIIPIVVRRVQAGEPIEIHGDGEQTRDFIYVSDTARAALILAETDGIDGEVFNVASGRETSVNELVRVLLKAMGKPDHPIHHVAPRPGDVRRHLADMSKAGQRLGFHPEVALHEGIGNTVEWYLS